MSTATCNAKAWLLGKAVSTTMGQLVPADTIYLAHRGIRTMKAQNGGTVQIGAENYSLVRTAARGREDFVACSRKRSGYPIWKRDFTGASALFAVKLKTAFLMPLWIVS